jgi:hypothetical protein
LVREKLKNPLANKEIQEITYPNPLISEERLEVRSDKKRSPGT